MKKMQWLLGVVVLCGGLALTGCTKPADKPVTPGKAVDKTIDNTKKAINDVKDAAKEGVDAAKDVVKEGADALKEGADAVKKAVE